jgi:FkbM family methyltransferase
MSVNLRCVVTELTLQSGGPCQSSSAHLSEPFISYAQNGEDVMLWRALSGVKRGYYVDVGAGEPEVDSVTCAFYQRGWRGVNIEPARGAFERLSAARSEDINLNVAAGDRNGMTSFFMAGRGNGLSDTVPEQTDSLQEQGWESTKTHVPVVTLASIIAEHVDGTVHFLKVDTEGSEREVLVGADLQRFRPWIILAEATAPNTQVPTYATWEQVLLDADYRFVWFDGLNRFYVAAEKADLAAAFQVQPNVFDGFVRHSEADAKAQLAQARFDLNEAGLREQHLEATRQAAETSLREQQFEAARHAAELAAQVACRVLERDTGMQELFEANRHAAYLTQSRQTLQARVQCLEGDVQRLEGDVQCLEGDVQCLEGDVQRLEGDVQRLEGDVQRLEGDRAHFRKFLFAMYASTSWKFARPVRVVAKLLGRR